MPTNLDQYTFIQKLKNLPQVNAIYLYGSRARGDNDTRSDIDLAISCQPTNDENWLQIIDIIDDADTLLEIDCVQLESLNPDNPLKQNILTEGYYLYKKYEKRNPIQTKIKNKKDNKNNNNKPKTLTSKLSDALSRLEEVISDPIDSHKAIIDATIQRFEFTFELFWKWLKILIQNQGLETNFPKEIIKAAYKAKMIDNEPLWLKMLNERNLTSHTYNRDLAMSIYLNIKNTYTPLIKNTFEKYKNKNSPHTK